MPGRNADYIYINRTSTVPFRGLGAIVYDIITMTKFAGKYRVESARASWWDYDNVGLYFLTINVENHDCCLGTVQSTDGVIQMQCNDLGLIAQRCWEEIPQHYTNVLLDAWVVMPNHIHGILQLTAPRKDAIYRVSDDDPGKDAIYRVSTPDAINRVSTDDGNNPISTTNETNHTTGGITGHHNPMLHNNVSRIIRWYKGRVAYECRKIYPTFAWQTRFYDIIIRDELSYQNIADYIHNNPARWYQDKFHPNNIQPGQ